MCEKRNVEIEKRGKNPMYFPIGYDYGICFFRNKNDYFIFDIANLEKISKHTWDGRKRENGKIDAYTKINGRTVYLTKYLMDTAVEDGYQCDHINGEPRDDRKCNLRLVTAEMNMLNTKMAEGIEGMVVEKEGKFVVDFPKYVANKTFNTKEEAEKELCKINECTYTYSQMIAKEIETNQFTKKNHYVGGVLEEIDNLPEKNIYKINLTNIERDKLNGRITEDVEVMRLLDLIDKYKCWKKDAV